MVHLKPVEMDNYYDCLELKRDDTKYVGNALDVIAEAYIYRETSRAYAIYNDDTVIGLVIIDEERRNKPYRFTDLFIADDYRNKRPPFKWSCDIAKGCEKRHDKKTCLKYHKPSERISYHSKIHIC